MLRGLKRVLPFALTLIAAVVGAASPPAKTNPKAKTKPPAKTNKPAKPKPAAKVNPPAAIPHAGPEDLAYLERAGASEIVFAVRSISPEHWYANFGYRSFGTEQKLYGKNGRLCKLNLKTGKLDVLLDDPEGAVRDPVVDYDGRRIVFAWRKGGTDNYHLYDIGADGTGLKQLTDGPYDDFEPSTLPDGGLIFVSSRCRRWVNCWVSQVANLHRCDRDGRNIRPLSANIEQDNTPWALPDGRILYMRWEYIDRSQVNYHHLWTMNPDGTGQTVYYGNQTPGNVYLDAKPIPGTGCVVLSKSPGHGRTEHEGALATVDDRHGPDDPKAITTITKEVNYRDPWPLDAGHFLAGREGALVLVHARGEAVKLYEVATPTGLAQERTIPDATGKPEKIKTQLWLHEPRPLRARPREAAIAPRTEPERATGRFMLSNVNIGRNMAGVAPGEIKQLLVVESLPKPVNFTGGMDPLSYVGTFTLERVLGTVPVEPDGSAYFEAPALRSLLFVALDAQGRAVKRMQSFTSLAPGETLGCVGCHEARTTAGSGQYRKPPRAAMRPASRIEPVAGVPDVLDFPRDIQPVLDRHCLTCHDTDKRAGGVLLSGDRGPMFSHGYYSLVVWGQVADGRNLAKSNYPPRALGSGGSALMAKLTPAHHGVTVSERERRTVALWLDSGAPYPGTYAALGTGMIGGYQQNKENFENDQDWPESRKAREVFAQRCAACHDAKTNPIPKYLADENELSFWEPKMNDPRLRRDRHIVFDLTRPEQSVYLLAPLARAAGGYGICRPKEAAKGAAGDTVGGVIGSRRDPDYQALRTMIEAGRRRLETIKRFDMPGFRPRAEYVREMKRYGVLPAELDAGKAAGAGKALIDIYDTDRKYWDLFVWPYAEAGVRGGEDGVK